MRLSVCVLLSILIGGLSAQAQRGKTAPSPDATVPDPILGEDATRWSAWPSVPPNRAPAQPPALPGTISAAELKLPARFFKEVQVSRKFYEARNFRQSAQHLERASQIEPNVAGVHQSLGLCYAQLGNYQRAAGEFQSASRLDPQLTEAALGMSGSLFFLKLYSEAEAAARRALEIDPQNGEANYLIGRSLAAQDHNTDEAVERLRRSGSDFPLANVVLAGVLLKRNAREEAIAEMRAYLQRPGVPLKEKVSCMVEKLTLPPDKTGCSLN